jgi:hypothetical protein
MCGSKDKIPSKKPRQAALREKSRQAALRGEI